MEEGDEEGEDSEVDLDVFAYEAVEMRGGMRCVGGGERVIGFGKVIAGGFQVVTGGGDEVVQT